MNARFFTVLYQHSLSYFSIRGKWREFDEIGDPGLMHNKCNKTQQKPHTVRKVKKFYTLYLRCRQVAFCVHFSLQFTLSFALVSYVKYSNILYAKNLTVVEDQQILPNKHTSFMLKSSCLCVQAARDNMIGALVTPTDGFKP